VLECRVELEVPLLAGGHFGGGEAILVPEQPRGSLHMGGSLHHPSQQRWGDQPQHVRHPGQHRRALAGHRGGLTHHGLHREERPRGCHSHFRGRRATLREQAPVDGPHRLQHPDKWLLWRTDLTVAK
jgi:hypothetical protein